MALTVYWRVFASHELDRIYQFYKPLAGSAKATEIVDEIIDRSLKLEQNPMMGPKEELPTPGENESRYLIHKNYKIIYWINREKDRIEITDVFDTRQNPGKLNRGK